MIIKSDYKGYKITAIPNLDGKTMLVTVDTKRGEQVWHNLHCLKIDEAMAWCDEHPLPVKRTSI